MCFSAKASFVAAGTLSVIGLLSVRTTKNKRLLPFAYTPLIFAVQQLCEGIVWLYITEKISSSVLYSAGLYGFIFFASIWWPLWLPTIFYFLKHNNLQKKLLFICFLCGFITALFYTIRLVSQPITVFVMTHHLYYPILSCPFELLIPQLYFVATVIPFFITTIRLSWIIGIIACISCIMSQIWFIPATASVWCFFAAIISILMYFVVKNNKIS